MLSKYKLNQLYFKDTQFANLMTRRIFNVLLIANPYDAFMLEDDGRIDEKKTGALMRRFSMNTLLCLCAIHLVSRRYLRRRKHCHSWKICRSTW